MVFLDCSHARGLYRGEAQARRLAVSVALYQENCITDELNRGNLIIIAGTTLAIVGLAFGGIRFPWVSVQVLAPLIIGVVVIGLFIVYEKYIPSEPAVPWEIISNRTTFGG